MICTDNSNKETRCNLALDVCFFLILIVLLSGYKLLAFFLIIFIWYIVFYLLNFNFCLSAYVLLCKQRTLDCASFNSCICAFMFVVIVDIFWTYFSHIVFSLFLNRAFSFILNN